MGRMACLALERSDKNNVTRDVIQTLAVYERVNTAKQFPVKADTAYDMAVKLFGEAVIPNDDNARSVFTEIAKTFPLSAYVQVASEATCENATDYLNNTWFMDGKPIAIAIDNVAYRCDKNGNLMQKRYTFRSFFRTFVEPFLLLVAYESIERGNVTFNLYPIKSADVRYGSKSLKKASDKN